MDPHPTALVFALALAGGALAQSLGRQLHIPGAAMLLAAGVVLGPELAGWIDPAALGGGLAPLVQFGMAIVLFQGGLNLDRERLRRQEAAIWRLVSAGALGTLGGAAVVAWLVLGWEWRTAVLFGSVVVVTGPSVVRPLLGDLNLHPRVRTLLEAEAALLDPVGALLAAFVLHAVTAPVGALASEALAVAGSIAFGLLAGIVVGLALTGAVRFRIGVAAGYENVVVLTTAILAFELSDFLVARSGLTAAVTAGIVFANAGAPVHPALREFTNPMTVALVGPLVVLLAAGVSLDDMRALGVGGFVVVAGLVLLVRPLVVAAATAGLGMTGRERAFAAWIAPRGLVAAVVASLTAATLDAEGGAGGGPLQALAFLTIAVTVLLAGLTVRPAAWTLGLLGAPHGADEPPAAEYELDDAAEEDVDEASAPEYEPDEAGDADDAMGPDDADYADESDAPDEADAVEGRPPRAGPADFGAGEPGAGLAGPTELGPADDADQADDGGGADGGDPAAGLRQTTRS